MLRTFINPPISVALALTMILGSGFHHTLPEVKWAFKQNKAAGGVRPLQTRLAQGPTTTAAPLCSYPSLWVSFGVAILQAFFTRLLRGLLGFRHYKEK